jgi:hypothetical protein
MTVSHFAGTRVAWGMDTRSKVQPPLLMLELPHLCQRLPSFFKKNFGSLHSFLFDWFWGFANSGKFLLRRPFSETFVHGNSLSTGKLTPFFQFLSHFLFRGCVLSGWGVKGFAFTLSFLFR